MGLLLVVAVITVPGWIPAFPKTLSTAGSWLSVAGMFLIAALFSALGIKLMGDRLRGFIPSFAAIFVLSALCQYVSMLPPIKTAGLESVFFSVILGLLIRNTVGLPKWLSPAVRSESVSYTHLVVPGASSDSFIVYGRGVLHLSVLIETMRREGYELQVGQPTVIIKEIDGKKCEPVEELTIDIPEAYSGKAIELVTKRKGTLLDMTSIYDRQRIVFEIPSRGIIGLRSNLLTATAGEAVMSHRLKGFEPYKGDMEMRQNGSLIAMETGTAYAYAINKLQDRGTFFVSPQDEIYAGQVVGESTRQEDIVINLTKSKKLTNMRASGSDDKVSRCV